MKLKKLAGALSFAHLLGLPGASAARAEDDEEKDKAAKAAEDDKQRDDESDEDYAKRMKEKDTGEDDDERDDTKGKGKSKRADDGDDGDGAGDDGDGSEGDDDAKASARRAERARCAAIVAFGVKNNCVRQAGVFAFDTNMTVAQAIAAISAGGADAKRSGSLALRMQGVAAPNVGADGGPGAPAPGDAAAAAKATAALIIRAGQKRRNEV